MIKNQYTYKIEILVDELLKSQNLDLVEIYFCGITPKDVKQYKYFIKFKQLLIKVDTGSIDANTISKANFRKTIRDYDLFLVSNFNYFYENIYTTNTIKKHSNWGEPMTHEKYLIFLNMVKDKLQFIKSDKSGLNFTG